VTISWGAAKRNGATSREQNEIQNTARKQRIFTTFLFWKIGFSSNEHHKTAAPNS
jgi:Mn-dependent DtxR family transcriptional regulator